MAVPHLFSEGQREQRKAVHGTGPSSGLSLRTAWCSLLKWSRLPVAADG